MNQTNRIVEDGCARAAAAVEPRIREAVNAEYAARLNGATVWARFRLKQKIEREIRRRVDESAPPSALY